MIYKFQFSTEEDKQSIIEANNDKYIIEINYFKNGNVIIFSDEQSLAYKISILTEENEKLKQELALTQDAVNEILFMMMNMEGK